MRRDSPICCADRSAPGRRVVVEERYSQIFKLDPHPTGRSKPAAPKTPLV
ncbi:MAG TPA: hypothetical protein VIJ23_05090 [Mycobacterium sp.]